MRSALILGTGRSGTSMIAGALSAAGYFQGDALHAPRASNPKGFFEAPEVNGINEALLAPMLDPAGIGLGDGQRWLGVPLPGATPRADAALSERMRRLTARAPFCLKDPRFSFTLDAWRPYLPAGAAFLCAFRHPSLTATSLVREVASASYLRGVPFELERAFALWIATYRAVLERHAHDGAWLFVHYDQMLEAEGRARLGAFLRAPVDGGFPDPRMRRSDPDVDAPAEALALYAELRARAGLGTRALAPAPRLPRVLALAWIGPDDAAHAPDLVLDARAQRGVDLELVLLDATEDGLAAPDGARVERGTWSRSADLRRAAAAADAPYVALLSPGARLLPAHCAHAIDALEAEGKDLATTDLLLADAEGRFVDRASPAAMGDVPGPWFEAGLVARREALRGLPDAAFFPGELALWRALRARGRTAHAAEPGVVVDRRSYVEAWDRAQEDAVLCRLASEPRADRPELSVSLCTFDRRATLRASLASFARQLVPPGSFELVVTDDGSSDGTAERLAELSLAIPLVRVRQENRGLAAARNAGLARARGRLVLFVNDDTIAYPDLVERHLARHAALGRDACVLGTFEQPAGARRNALCDYLEGSTEVFGYAAMKALEEYDGFRFWTCNVSAPLARVRAAGGFDESFRHYGCEDTDLGVRLERSGLRVVYDPAARALHLHRMDFDYVRGRARTVARAYARLVRKHPDLLERWGNQALDRARCERELARDAARLAELEGAARELARIDVGALSELDGSWRELARDVALRLGELIPDANRLWWRRGYLEGLREHGLEGFSELLEHGAGRRPIRSESGRALLAWPDWRSPESLDRLLERVRPIAADGFATLLLRRDPEADPPQAEALAALEAAWARAFGSAGDLEVVIEDAPLARTELLQLGRSVEGLCPLGNEPEAFLAAVGAERFDSAEAVAAWRARYEGLPEARGAHAPPARAAAPELTVVVPTRDRPRELLQLLEALRAQDLAPERFEVIVSDDGSRSPVAPLVARRAYPFAVQVVAGPPSGPGAARNRALRLARGGHVAFFNDDAVPAPDCLTRHLRAHAATAEPVAVLGTFRLLPRHVADSFALAVERTNVLFAQPLMKPGVRYHGLALCTGNVSLRREHLERAGGFDERLRYPGGEDSELGLRLERELGLRVVFDPRVACGHDHALDVESFARRRRVVGWSAYAIQARHPGAGLFQVASWEALEREVEAEAPERARLLEALRDLCARERAGAPRPGTTPEALGWIRRLSELELRAGIALAHRGEAPEPLPAQGAPARAACPPPALAGIADPKE